MKTRFSGRVTALVIGLLLATGVVSVQAQTFTVLYTFSGAGGSGPDGTLAMDGAGNLYGTTYFGGAYTDGAIFKLDPSGNETVLFNGNTNNSIGAYPIYGVTLGRAGDMFSLMQGSVEGGGEIVGRVAGRGKILYDFGTCLGDCYVPDLPYGGLLQDSAGNLYGVTYFGGVKGQGLVCEMSGCGTVYKFDTKGNFHVLYAFTGGSDGAYPYGSLIQDAAGNFYGATINGGDLSCQAPRGCGTVFKLAQDGTLTVLHTFSGTDGIGPEGALVADAAGNLYGAAQAGGNPNCYNGCGTLFKIDANGKFTLLYTFTDGVDASYPNGNMVLDGKGNLYGDAAGDFGTDAPYGTVFELTAAGRFTVLHKMNGNTDGADPAFGLIRDSAGNLYGTAYQGYGLHDRNGTVFKVTP